MMIWLGGAAFYSFRALAYRRPLPFWLGCNLSPLRTRNLGNICGAWRQTKQKCIIMMVDYNNTYWISWLSVSRITFFNGFLSFLAELS